MGINKDTQEMWEVLDSSLFGITGLIFFPITVIIIMVYLPILILNLVADGIMFINNILQVIVDLIPKK